MSKTHRVIAPRGVINPDGHVYGTVVGYSNGGTDEAGNDLPALAAVLVDFDPLDRVAPPSMRLPRHADHPVYVNRDNLAHFTYEPSVEVTHDGGFESPEESAIALLEWLKEELTGNAVQAGKVHVSVRCEDGLTYQVAVDTRAADGSFSAEVTNVRVGG